jgi:hypothetical protein
MNEKLSRFPYVTNAQQNPFVAVSAQQMNEEILKRFNAMMDAIDGLRVEVAELQAKATAKRFGAFGQTLKD